MKMREILYAMKSYEEYKANKRVFDVGDIAEFESELNTGTYIGYHKEFEERVEQFPINAWVCTDTEVGLYCYFFDGEFIALSFQTGRKNDITFQWKDRESAQKVRDFILKLHREEEVDTFIGIINEDEEVAPEWFTSH